MIPGRELAAADWHRLNSLLAQAFELEDAARRQWLAALPGEAADLKPLLEQLLSDEQDLEGTKEAMRPVAALGAEAMAVMRREAPGDRIGPWQLERLLAEGGMGSVWKAERVDGVMKRTAALKLPRAAWVDRGLAGRIARERTILARLQHPHIAVLYDAGLADGGRPYLALEYVDGVPIDSYCRGRSVPETLRLFVQVVRAVAYAHGQLVIHRDLKPANVLVTAGGMPKLLDFGISQLIEGETPLAEATALTRMAGRPMTLAYAAPEQVLSLPITVAADVYSMGVMLFELMAGTRPYRATEPRALEAELLRGDLRRPSDAAADQARARLLKGDLDAIIGVALKRNPAERYGSAAALADDLERHLTGRPVRARPDSRTYLLKKFVVRNRLVVAAVGAFVLALGLGLGLAMWKGYEALQQARRATALNTFVLGLIQTADPNANAQTKAADLAMLRSIEERIDHDFRGSPDQVLQLRVTVGDAYRNRGESAAAIRVYERAVAEAALKLPADDLMLLTARVRSADDNLNVSMAASESLDGAIEILRSKGEAGADILVDALLIRHALASDFGVPEFPRWDRRMDALQEALALALRYFGAGSRQHLRVLVHYPSVAATSERVIDALSALRDGLAAADARDDGATSSPEYRDAGTAYAERLCETGRAREGMRMLSAARAALNAANGDTSLQLERLVAAIGSCENALDDVVERNAVFEAYAIAAARERPPSTNLMRRAEHAQQRALDVRYFETAERYYLSAVENSQAIVDPLLRERLMRRVESGRICQLAYQGHLAEAETVAAKVLKAYEIDDAKSGRPVAGQDNVWNCLSFAQRQQGRYDEAIVTAGTYLGRCLKTEFKSARSCSRGIASKALAELDAGRPAEAMATLQQQPDLEQTLPFMPDLQLAYARALLAAGRVPESLQIIRQAYAEVRARANAHDIDSTEVQYWLGQALIAGGELRAGREMVQQARPALAQSSLPSQRALAARPIP